jgi:hypothetical protein
MAKNGYVHEGMKVGRSNATPTKLFSVGFYDLKFMSFKFGNDILMSVWKINISLLFRPFASEVLE